MTALGREIPLAGSKFFRSQRMVVGEALATGWVMAGGKMAELELLVRFILLWLLLFCLSAPV